MKKILWLIWYYCFLQIGIDRALHVLLCCLECKNLGAVYPQESFSFCSMKKMECIIWDVRQFLDVLICLFRGCIN